MTHRIRLSISHLVAQHSNDIEGAERSSRFSHTIAPPEPLMSQARAKASLQASVGRPRNQEGDPGKLGTRSVLTAMYEFLPMLGPVYWPGMKLYGQLYWPVAAPNEKLPVVLIVHARKASPLAPYLLYTTLAKHLASHGFVVVSISRGPSLPNTDKYTFDDKFDVALQETVRFLYTSSQVKPLLSNDVALIAHSSGGSLAIQHCRRIRNPSVLFAAHAKNLISLILFAPTIPDNFDVIKSDLDLASDSFLGIHAVDDSDSAAYGKKMSGELMKSTFLMYDTMGTRINSSQTSLIEKDMIFARRTEGAAIGHHLQNELFTRAYVTAFLKKHILKIAEYGQYLKLQVRPDSLVPFPKLILWQQHEERNKLSITDIDHSDGLLSTIETSPLGIVTSQVQPWVTDNFSPHATKCWKIVWDRTKPPANTAPSNFTLKLKATTDVSSFAFFSFRICQTYPGFTQTLDISITIGGTSVLMSSFGGGLHFPPLMAILLSDGTPVNATKNALQTYLIPLNSFPVQNLKAVTQISFDLTINGNQKAVLYLDSVQFIH